MSQSHSSVATTPFPPRGFGQPAPAPVAVFDASAFGAHAGSRIIIPGGDFLLTAQFRRVGGDLMLTGADGHQVVVTHYFDGPPTDLSTDYGAVIHGDLATRLAGSVAPGAYAQAAGGAAPQPIGLVDRLTGTATVHHADGSTEILAKGAPVYSGDVLETAAESSVGLVLADRTTFALGGGGRMVMDDVVYDSDSHTGHESFSVVQGTFSFVSGQIAKTAPDAMTVRTPVMTIGVRGTTVAGHASAEGTDNTVTLLPDADGGVGQIVVSNSAGSVVLTAPDHTVSLTSNFQTPPPPVVMPPAQVQEIYHQIIEARPPQPAQAPVLPNPAAPQQHDTPQGAPTGTTTGSNTGSPLEQAQKLSAPPVDNGQTKAGDTTAHSNQLPEQNTTPGAVVAPGAADIPTGSTITPPSPSQQNMTPPPPPPAPNGQGGVTPSGTGPGSAAGTAAASTAGGDHGTGSLLQGTATTSAPVTTVAPVTLSPITLSPVQTQPPQTEHSVTSAPAVTASVGTADHPAITSSIITTVAPATTTAPATSAPLTSAPVTSAPVTAAPTVSVTTAPTVTETPVTTTPAITDHVITAAPTEAPVTTAPVHTDLPATTAPAVTSAPVGTTAPTVTSTVSITSAPITTSSGSSDSGSSDSGSGSSGSGTTSQTLKIIDGYVAGATVTRHTAGGDYTATTDLNGNVTLQGSGGTILASGGTDTLTHQTLLLTMQASGDSGVVTPLTTLLALSGQTEAQFKANMGIDSSIDLTQFDPQAATAGNALAAAKVSALVVSTVNTLQSSTHASFASILQAVATSVANNPGIDLTTSGSLNNVVSTLSSQTFNAYNVDTTALANANQTLATAIDTYGPSSSQVANDLAKTGLDTTDATVVGANITSLKTLLGLHATFTLSKGSGSIDATDADGVTFVLENSATMTVADTGEEIGSHIANFHGIDHITVDGGTLADTAFASWPTGLHEVVATGNNDTVTLDTTANLAGITDVLGSGVTGLLKVDASGLSHNLTITGGSGTSTLIGGTGNNTLYAGTGDSTLIGGSGEHNVNLLIESAAATGVNILLEGGGQTASNTYELAYSPQAVTTIEPNGSTNVLDLSQFPHAAYYDLLRSGYDLDLIYGTTAGNGTVILADYFSPSYDDTAGPAPLVTVVGQGGTTTLVQEFDGTAHGTTGDDIFVMPSWVDHQTLYAYQGEDLFLYSGGTGHSIIGTEGGNGIGEISFLNASLHDANGTPDSAAGTVGVDITLALADTTNPQHGNIIWGATSLLAFDNIAISQIDGSSYDDTITGSGGVASSLMVRGESGCNTIINPSGNVWGIHNPQGARLTVDYLDGPSGITPDLSTGTTVWVTNGWGGIDTLENVTGLRGSSHDDTLTGRSGDATIFYVSEGNDTYHGQNYGILDYSDSAIAGSYGLVVNLNPTLQLLNLLDTTRKATLSNTQLSSFAGLHLGAYHAEAQTGSIDSFDGIQWIRGSAYGDTVYGGSGETTGIDYSGSASGITASLGSASGYAIKAAGTITDSLINVTTVHGTASGDSFIAHSGSETIDGGGGADTVTLAGSNATLTLLSDGAMADTIHLQGGSSSAADIILGGSLYNTTDYLPRVIDASATQGATTFDLTHLNGSGTAGLDLKAGSGNTTIVVNTLSQLHNVTLEGGSGTDSLIVSGFDGGTNNLSLGEGSSSLLNLSNVKGFKDLILEEGNSAACVAGTLTLDSSLLSGFSTIDLAGTTHSLTVDISQAQGSNVVYASATAADIFIAGTTYGSDTLYGSSGTADAVDYSGSSGGVTVALAATVSLASTTGYAVKSSGSHTDTLVNISIAHGSAHDDTFIATSGSETIDGGGGSDTVSLTGSNATLTLLSDGVHTDTIHLRGGSGNSAYVTLGNSLYNSTDALPQTVDASATQGATTFDLTHLSGSSTAGLELAAGSGTTTIAVNTLSQLHNVTLDGGSGTDSLIVSGFDGGTNNLSIGEGSSSLLNLLNVKGFKDLILKEGNGAASFPAAPLTLDSNVLSGFSTIDLTGTTHSLAVNISQAQGSNVVYASTTTADTFIVGSGNETIGSGGGSDTVSLTGSNATLTLLSDGIHTGTIHLQGGSSNSAYVTLGTSLYGSTDNLPATIDASATQGATTFDLTHLSGSGTSHISLTAGSGNTNVILDTFSQLNNLSFQGEGGTATLIFTDFDGNTSNLSHFTGFSDVVVENGTGATMALSAATLSESSTITLTNTTALTVDLTSSQSQNVFYASPSAADTFLIGAASGNTFYAATSAQITDTFISNYGLDTYLGGNGHDVLEITGPGVSILLQGNGSTDDFWISTPSSATEVYDNFVGIGTLLLDGSEYQGYSPSVVLAGAPVSIPTLYDATNDHEYISFNLLYAGNLPHAVTMIGSEGGSEFDVYSLSQLQGSNGASFKGGQGLSTLFLHGNGNITDSQFSGIHIQNIDKIEIWSNQSWASNHEISETEVDAITLGANFATTGLHTVDLSSLQTVRTYYEEEQLLSNTTPLTVDLRSFDAVAAYGLDVTGSATRNNKFIVSNHNDTIHLSSGDTLIGLGSSDHLILSASVGDSPSDNNLNSDQLSTNHINASHIFSDAYASLFYELFGIGDYSTKTISLDFASNTYTLITNRSLLTEFWQGTNSEIYNNIDNMISFNITADTHFSPTTHTGNAISVDLGAGNDKVSWNAYDPLDQSSVYLDGGSGTNTLALTGSETSPYSVRFNLSSSNEVSANAHAEVENFQNLDASSFTMHGSASLTVTANQTDGTGHVIHGAIGISTLIGGGGSDVIYGGNDVLGNGETSSTTLATTFLIGGLGQDTLVGGTGTNFFEFTGGFSASGTYLSPRAVSQLMLNGQTATMGSKEVINFDPSKDSLVFAGNGSTNGSADPISESGTFDLSANNAGTITSLAIGSTPGVTAAHYANTNGTNHGELILVGSGSDTQIWYSSNAANVTASNSYQVAQIDHMTPAQLLSHSSAFVAQTTNQTS